MKPYEYQSHKTLGKWNVHGLRRGHTCRSHEDGREQGSQAHNPSGTTGLNRDENIHTQPHAQTNAESIKGYYKKVTKIQQQHSKGPTTHMDKHGKDDIKVGNYKDGATASSNTEARTSNATFGPTQGHTYLSHEAATERRSLALNSSRITGLYRDKVIYTHSDVQNHIRASGGYGEKVTEEKESGAEDQTTAVVKLQGILGENIKDGGDVEKDARLRELVRDEATDEAIERGWTTVLHRDEAKSGTKQGWTTGRHKDEAMDTHPYIQAVLHRDEAKNGTEQGWTTGLHRDEAIDGAIERGVTTVPHRERRKYRRTTHKDPTCTDRPGLRGPKATGTLGARDWARESAGMATR